MRAHGHAGPRLVLGGLTMVMVAGVAFGVIGAAIAQGSAGETLTLEDEVRAGEALFQNDLREYGLVDQERSLWVQNIVRRIAAASGERTYLTFHAAVVKDKEWNAHAWPGGYIICNEGLIATDLQEANGDMEKSEALVAATMAHEVAHVMHRDTDRSARTYLKHPDAAWSSLQKYIDTESGPAVLEQYRARRRQQEDDADRDGMWYLVRAGYPAQAMVDEARMVLRLFGAGLLRPNEMGYSYDSARLSNVMALQAKIVGMQAKYEEAVLTLKLGFQDDRLDQAASDLQMVAKFFPTSVEVHHALGVAYHQRFLRSTTPAQLVGKPSFGFYTLSVRGAGEPDLAALQAAVDEYGLILDAFKDAGYKGVHWTVSALGLALVQAGKVDEGLPFCQKAVELAPEDWHCLNSLGIAYLRKGEAEKARQCFAQAITAAEKRHGAELGRLLKETAGGTQVASLDVGRLNLQRVLQVDFSPAVYNAAIAARDSKDASLASTLFNAYLQMDSESVWAQQTRRELEALPRGSEGGRRPAKPTKICGISKVQNGDSVTRVRSVYGAPEEVKQIKDQGALLCYPAEGLFFVAADNTVMSIMADKPFAEPIGGVKIGNRVSAVTGKFGDPIGKEEAEQGISWWDYSPWGVFFAVQQDAVVMVHIVGQPEAKPAEKAPTEPAPAAGEETEKVRGLVSLGILPGDPAEFVRAKLGDPESTEEGAWLYSSRGVNISFDKRDNVALIAIAGAQEHVAGVRVGASISAVLQGLGDPVARSENPDGTVTVFYRLKGRLVLVFIVQDDKVRGIALAKEA